MQISKLSLWICALTLCGGIALHAKDTPAQAAARAALMKKMRALEGNGTVAPQASAPAKTKTAVPAPAPAASQSPAAQSMAAPAETMASAPMASGTQDNSKQAEARTALEKKLRQLNGSSPASTAASAASANSNAMNPAPAQPGSSEVRIQAPPPPVSMSKVEQLQGLLNLYMANQITPEQYQQKRAAIMGKH